MSRERAAIMFEHQARACAELGSPLYAALLRRAARDIREGGPCADAVAGHEDAPGPDAIALRLLGGVHALVLTGRAPEAAVHYPSAGGTFDPDRAEDAWQAVRAAVAGGMDWVREWMARPPQTNETGRSNLLMAGLLRAVSVVSAQTAVPTGPLPVRLFELGSSAGLNLRADRFRYTAGDFAWGPEDSPLTLTDCWSGTPDWLRDAAARHPSLSVVERRGCDPRPVDPLSAEGALALRAYVWPDQTERAARLRGALRLANAVPAEVEAAGAAGFLSRVGPAHGTLTVVWHSVMRQYVAAPEWARVEQELGRLAAQANGTAGFAHVSFEPHRVGDEHRCLLTVRIADGPVMTLAEAPPHGLPAHGSAVS